MIAQARISLVTRRGLAGWTRGALSGWAAVLLAVVLAAAIVAGCEPADQAGSAAPGDGDGVVLRVAAASDLRYALEEIARLFEEQNPGVRVQVTYGSSGNFHAQLSNRAPFDIYLSADLRYPRDLVDSGVAGGQEVFQYAIGRLAVWVPAASPIDVESLGMDSLLAADVRRIGIANPRHAPYGVAAVEALRHAGVHDRLESRLVYGENVAQAAHLVASGGADAGVIALSLALAPVPAMDGRHWEIPQDHFAPLVQGGLILPWTRHPRQAEALRDTILGEAGRRVLLEHGFFLPGD